jgi:hypothetical protein
MKNSTLHTQNQYQAVCLGLSEKGNFLGKAHEEDAGCHDTFQQGL